MGFCQTSADTMGGQYPSFRLQGAALSTVAHAEESVGWIAGTTCSMMFVPARKYARYAKGSMHSRTAASNMPSAQNTDETWQRDGSCLPCSVYPVL